jgi:hypothetical protein
MLLNPKSSNGIFGCVQVQAQSGTCSTYNPPQTESFSGLTFVADTYIDSQNPTTAYGANTKVSLGNFDSVDPLNEQNEQYALVRFEATTIPTDISSAFIRFPLRKLSTSVDQNGDSMVLSANRITRDFIEINGIVNDPKTGEIIASGPTTWNTRPQEDTSGLYTTSTVFATNLMSNLFDSYIDLPITNYVKAVKAGTISNNGLILRVALQNQLDEVRPFGVQFNARPGNGSAPWPIVYWYRNATGTGNGTPSPGGPGGYSPPPVVGESPTPPSSPSPTASPSGPGIITPPPVEEESPTPMYSIGPPTPSPSFIFTPILPPCPPAC